MDFTTLIAARQSCRAFDQDKTVGREEINACLAAARLAPSACNSQPWHFTVCTGELAKQAALCTQGLGMNKFATSAPCLIVISEGGCVLSATVAGHLEDRDFRSIDIGAAASYLTLAAAERGLATCILGWFDEKRLRKLLNITSRIRLVVLLGYAAEDYPLRPKIRKKTEELVTFAE